MCFKLSNVKDNFTSSNNGKWSSGKYEERKCTDCYCTFVFVSFWTAMVAVLCAAFWLGDPTLQRIFYGTDYRGHTCGVDHSVDNGPNLLEKKKIIYPRMMQDILMHAYDFATDVKGINNIVENPDQITSFITEFHPFGVCVEECPKGGDFVCTYDWENKVSDADVKACYAKDEIELGLDIIANHIGFSKTNCEDILANCFPVPVDNQDYFFRCLPLYRSSRDKTEECVEWFSENNTDKTVQQNYDCLAVKVTEFKETIKPSQGDFIMEVVSEQIEVLNNVLDDFFKARMVLVTVGFIGAVVMSLLWIVILRFFAGVIVWTSIVLVYILMAGLVILCYFKSSLITGTDMGQFMNGLDDVQSEVAATFGENTQKMLSNATSPLGFLFDSKHAETWKYIAYVSTGVYVVFVIIGLIMLKKVIVAVKIIQETTNAIKDMPLIMLWPLFPSAFILVMLIYFLYTACFIGSMGYITPHTMTQAALKELQNLTSLSLFNNGTIVDTKAFDAVDLQPVFQLYNVFMVFWTVGLINAISFTTMAGAFCRWYWSKGDERLKETFPICRSYGRVMQYHFGTMAVGSFILALLSFVRLLLLYLERKTRSAQQNSSCVRTLFKVVHCMLFLFDRCLKYLARQAYIMVAMYGYNFCKASVTAVLLITSNILQVAAVNLINRYVMFLGKLVVLASCIVSGYLWLTYSEEFHGDGALWSMIPVIVVIALFAFAVCSYVFAIYNVGVDTILLCFCQDCMMHENIGDSDTKLFNKGMQSKIKKITNADRVQAKYAQETELTETLNTKS